MDAYFCLCPEEIRVAVYEDYFVNAGHWEWYQPAELIFAETRGQARALFCSEHDLEFTEKMSIRKIASNVNRDYGIANFDDVIWIYVDPLSWVNGPFSDLAEYIIKDKRDYPTSQGVL